ncbi:hypothetical protein AJ78_06589 [Emergomyces pasteurianus Ep9510]|uniref:Mannan endo-1,6-alpha-mannosidase n=1 Tax=Emergomyces pasteurianus Ep9510 TaxID=1447872 RepID=A0A1J9PA99_9EURO|nr:hypothetical protein AJ78_06589 [Emergomyces pasteurianus Ep9510]
MKVKQFWAVLAAACIGIRPAIALDDDLKVNSIESTKAAATAIARGAVKYYKGNEPGGVPGLLSEPYNWWQSAVLFGTLVDYRYFSGDSSYNDIVKQALLSQMGQNHDFQPANQSKEMTNYDQAQWALAAMSAAEFSFDAPGSDGPDWVDLAKAVFDTQTKRWDDKKCGGGLREQIFTVDGPASVKDSMSNGALFELSSRLARYTKDERYATWAKKAWDWMSDVGLLTKDFEIYDSANSETDCKEVRKFQWSVNVGSLLSGAAYMYNSTNGDPTWKSRVEALLKGANVFFKNDIMVEAACEANNQCNLDHKTYKAILSRALGTTLQLAPFTNGIAAPKVKASAKAAVDECENENGFQMCSYDWVDTDTDDDDDDDKDKEDDDETLGEQLSALQIVLAVLAADGNAPAPGSQQSPTGSPGGSSRGGSGGTPTSGAPPSTSSPGAASSVMDLGIQQWGAMIGVTGLSALLALVM